MNVDWLNVYLIEHGLSREVCGNDIIGDVRNFPLSLTGLRQTSKLKDRLLRDGIKFDRTYSTPVFYGVQTANNVFGQGNYDIDDRLDKLGHGGWEGRTYRESYPPEVMAALEGNLLHWKGHGGDSQYDVGMRMFDFLENSRLLVGGNGNVGAVTHKIPIRSLIRVVSGLDISESQDIEIENTSLTTLRYEGGIWKVLKINDHDHLL